MTEYVERESLYERINKLADTAKERSLCASEISDKNRYADIWSGLCKALYEVRHSVSADVASVVHGRWEEVKPVHYLCSICSYKAGGMTFNYCPNCGAKMDSKG